MCGIAGILNLSPATPPARERLVAMISVLHHRGPDAFGYYGDGDTGLAHARLSIIDVEGGAQPIHNETESVWVVFNGEIFNFVELRRTLEGRGHRFYTRTDTEVIVHLYEEYGDTFVDHLNGQFAIALWDRTHKRLFLARDRAGIRPLFYTLVDGRLLFGSEVKALFAAGDVPRLLRHQALGAIFTFWTTLGSATIFAGVESLPPGHVMVVEDGRPRIWRYWDWSFPEAATRATRPEAEYVEELRALLIDAIRLQLRADVPVGAYLSGGLDSSIIASLIHHHTESPLHTFSIAFAGKEFDESAQQREVAGYLGTHHSEFRCTTADIGAAFPRTLWHAESPILRTGPTPLLLLSEHVRAAGYKVVLTGEGADEVFGGYDLFKEAKVRRFWARNPASRWRPRILARLYPYLEHSPVSGAFAQQFFAQGLGLHDKPYFGHLPRWSTTRRLWKFFSADVRQELSRWDPYAEIDHSLPAASERWAPLSRDQYIEAHTLLEGYLLSSQGDRMAMANSVEGRFPFLDHRVIEFANRLPVNFKIRGLQEKYLLRQAARDLLPEAIRRRPKQPYRAPDSQSFFHNQRSTQDYVDAMFDEGRLRDSGYFDPRAARLLYEKCRNGRAVGFGDNMAFVGILSTMLVDELFVRNNTFHVSAEAGMTSRFAHFA
jgi:asparagine synthase (glutamine-hydrolysing)